MILDEDLDDLDDDDLEDEDDIEEVTSYFVIFIYIFVFSYILCNFTFFYSILGDFIICNSISCNLGRLWAPRISGLRRRLGAIGSKQKTSGEKEKKGKPFGLEKNKTYGILTFERANF